MPRLDLAQPPPMAERLADALREAIVSGSVPPGSRLNESGIAAAHRISRSPIREAIRILEQQGFVRIEPRRGAFVTALTAREVLEVYGVKAMIEGYATGLATVRLTRADLETLESLLLRMEGAAAAGSPPTYVELTRQFHDLIVRASGNETLAGIYHGLDRKIHGLRKLSLSDPARVRVSLDDHRQILEAIRRREAARAEQLARAHIERAAAALVPRLERLLGAAADGGAALRARTR